MRKKICALFMTLGVLSVVAWDVTPMHAAEEEPETRVLRVVTPIENVNKFEVTGRSTLFRLVVTTPSGGTIELKSVKGPAKHLRTAEIIRVNEQSQPMIGALEREFEFRGTGSGKVTIQIERTVPPERKPVVESFEVEIK